MHRSLFLSLLLFLVLVPAAIAAPVTLTAVLNGANERPGPGDADGIGFAVVRLDPAAGTVTYSLLAEGIATPNAAHIHRGLPDVAGGVVVNFAPTFTNGAATGTVNASPALINEIINNPGAFYVNIHNADFQGGAIRGQLTGAASSNTVALSATMNGANERPGPGDADGTGVALVRFDRNTNTVHYAIVVQNIAQPNAAHIHRGAADVPGDVVVNFRPTFVNGVAAGSVSASATIIDEILANPAGFYVNVHNPEFQAGAVRGQLTAAQVGMTDSVIPIVGRAAGANGTFYRTDLALVNVSGAATQVVLEYYASGFTANATPTARTTLLLGSNEQVNLSGDMLQTALGVDDGTGALRVVSTRAISAVARIYNDRRVENEGTLSQFVPALDAEENRTSGVLPLLANQQAAAGGGYRTNIGWFNGSSNTSTVTFRAHRPNGTILGTATRDVAAGSQLQVPLNQLFPSLEPLDNMFVTFTTTGAPLYVYASVVDNVNGDGIFINARPR